MSITCTPPPPPGERLRGGDGEQEQREGPGDGTELASATGELSGRRSNASFHYDTKLSSRTQGSLDPLTLRVLLHYSLSTERTMSLTICKSAQQGPEVRKSHDKDKGQNCVTVSHQGGFQPRKGLRLIQQKPRR